MDLWILKVRSTHLAKDEHVENKCSDKKEDDEEDSSTDSNISPRPLLGSALLLPP